MVIPQTANVVGFLKDDHIETSFEAALCRANSGHAGADDGHSFGHLLWCCAGFGSCAQAQDVIATVAVLAHASDMHCYCKSFEAVGIRECV
ncbi:hypothetical protein TYRP_001229 [Tyrophagus putrescentiae]|nr:hypothetical protein TYRP_001229 [Tyrophagus putrescentiae]